MSETPSTSLAVTSHVVALSGGKDSTAMALRLMEVEPRDYTFVCTPTGDELPEMFDHWNRVAELLGKPILPVMAMWPDKETGKTVGGLRPLFGRMNSLPNRKARWCTRVLKIEPYRAWLMNLGPVVSYVGLRADEEGRAGGAYADLAHITNDFPLRRWGWDVHAVMAYLDQRGIRVPERTDCARCYHQQIGEWWRLWREFPDLFAEAIADEAAAGGTFREPKFGPDGEEVWTLGRGKPGTAGYMRWPRPYLASSRDSWPVRLADLAELFSAGFIPPSANRQHDLFRGSGACRVCTL